MVIRVGVIGSDAYSINLMKYINSNYSDMKISVFSDCEIARKYIEDNGLDGIVVFGNFNESMMSEYGMKMAYFTEQKMEKEKYIYKYQAFDVIHNKLFDCFLEPQEKVHKTERVFAVYSPLGRCGKTKLAIDLCNKNSRTLYIGWENFSGMTNDDVACKYYNQFMFFLAEKNNSIVSLMNEALDNNCKFLRGGALMDDIDCIDEKVLRWLSDMLGTCDYDISVVFDINHGCIKDYRLLEGAERVYIPTLSDEISKRKMISFRNHISRKKINNKNFYVVDENRNINRW